MSCICCIFCDTFALQLSLIKRNAFEFVTNYTNVFNWSITLFGELFNIIAFVMNL